MYGVMPSESQYEKAFLESYPPSALISTSGGAAAGSLPWPDADGCTSCDDEGRRATSCFFALRSSGSIPRFSSVSSIRPFSWGMSPVFSSLTLNARISRVSWSIMTLSRMNPRLNLCVLRIHSPLFPGVMPVQSGITRTVEVLPLAIPECPFTSVVSTLLILLCSVVKSGAFSLPSASCASPSHTR